MADHFEEKSSSFKVVVSKGFTTLNPSSFSVPYDESIRDFRTPIKDKLSIKKMAFDGFQKCLYAVQKFDSDSERRFAAMLENDPTVLKWFKPAKNVFRINYTNEGSYEPDFVVETKEHKYLCEPKRSTEMDDEIVLAKAKAAAQWCKHATSHELEHGGKEWNYLLIPHDKIRDNKTLQGLTAAYTFMFGTE